MASTDDTDRRRTICLDFDGVIHGYSRGWHDGSIYDPPCEGAYESIRRLAAEFRLVVSTCRDDVDGIWDWLRKHGLSQYISQVTNFKPVASLYVDDRGLRHIGWASTMADIECFLQLALTTKGEPGC